MKVKMWVRGISIVAVFGLLFVIRASFHNDIVKAQPQASGVPQFKYDGNWPKPLPDTWVLGAVGSVCVDSHDHVFAVTRGAMEKKEMGLATPAPPVLEWDDAGNLVNSWGDRSKMAAVQHGCFFDKEDNFYTAGNNDGIVQKWTHDGSKLLLQIGTRGVMDSADGTARGLALNASKTGFYKPTQVAVDPTNGDIYVSDGYGNKRVAVFDKDGHFLRQWGRQATQEETDAGVGGVFLSPVHCVVIGHDGLVYVADRLGDRVEVFDKMGNFKRNIKIPSETAHRKNSENAVGTAGWIGFSTDPAQKYMYVANGADNNIAILDHASGEVLAKIGRPGRMPGGMTDPHSIAVNSKGDIIVGEVPYGGDIEMWRLVK